MSWFKTILQIPMLIVFLVSLSGANADAESPVNVSPEMQKFYQTLSENWHMVSSKVQSQLGKEFDRLNANTVVGLKNNELTIIGAAIGEIPQVSEDFSFSSNLYYQIVVQPSFYKGKQLRKDIYVIGLSGSNIVSLGTELRITFFREFESKAEAIFTEPPYWISRFPKNWEDLQTQFKDREGVRVELVGNTGLSTRLSEKATSSSLGASLGFSFEGLFLIDIYKNSVADARVRFLSSRNKGTTRLRADATLGKKIFSFAPRWLKDLTQIGFTIDGQKSLNPFNEFPIETNFFDYYFKHSSLADGEQFNAPTTLAFNEILTNLLKGHFKGVFDPRLSESDIVKQMIDGSRLAHKLAIEDDSKPIKERRVLQIFHGQMSANILSFNWGPKISHLFRYTNGFGNSKIFVSSLKSNQEYDHYILLNAFTREKNSAFFGRSESEFISDIDALFTSNANKEAKDLNDFIMRVQYKDKEMGTSEYRKIRNIIESSIPKAIENKDKILNLIPQKNQKNALLSFKYSLSANAFNAIQKIPASTLYYDLYYYIENHPEKSFMDLPTSHPEGGYQQSYSDFIQNLTQEIKSLANTEISSNERFAALERLMQKKVFSRYLINQYIPSLIPAENFEKDMNLQIVSSSRELPTQTESIGANRVSSVYDSVQFLRTILNDRNYDLKIETIQNENGDIELVLSRMTFKPQIQNQ